MLTFVCLDQQHLESKLFTWTGPVCSYENPAWGFSVEQIISGDFFNISIICCNSLHSFPAFGEASLFSSKHVFFISTHFLLTFDLLWLQPSSSLVILHATQPSAVSPIIWNKRRKITQTYEGLASAPDKFEHNVSWYIHTWTLLLPFWDIGSIRELAGHCIVCDIFYQQGVSISALSARLDIICCNSARGIIDLSLGSCHQSRQSAAVALFLQIDTIRFPLRGLVTLQKFYKQT